MSTVSSILGHASELAALQNDIATGNVAHAYLFAGSKGIGKFTVAKWFAEQLLTQGLEGEEKARTAVEVAKLLHADLHVLDWLWIEDIQEDFAAIARHSNVPQEHRKKAKAKTDTISIDDIRSMQERLHDVGNGRYKCCLIRSVERMQDAAVNALLKILEEPPEGTVFVLTTESLASLLPTLLSRARVLRFSRLSDHTMQPTVQALSPEDRRFVLRIAQGAPGVAIRLASDPDQLRTERQIFGDASAFWSTRSLLERLRILTPLHTKGEASDRFLFHLALALREELPNAPVASAERLMQLVRGLQTNASRQSIVQRFALSAGV